MFKKILIALVVVVAVVLVYATTRPDSFRVERTATIAAPPEKIYPLLTDFTANGWGSWSPWEKLDPNLKRTFSGAPTGKGAVYQWDGEKAGAGRMEIRDATPSSKVNIALDFTKPMQAHNTAEFTLTPAPGGTRVNWAMYGPNPYLAKLMQMFFDMDTLVGKDFETGLANLKARAARE